MLDSVLHELGSKGYAEFSVQDVLGAVGVSAAEFEVEYGEKDTVLAAAYRRLSGRLLESATSACSEDEPWPQRIRLGLKSVLQALATEPEMARVLVRVFPGIRPEMYQAYGDLLAGFVPFMQPGREYSGVESELPGKVEMLAVGAAETIILLEVDAGRAENLPAMLPEILFLVLVPFIGPERAAEEMQSTEAAS